MASMFYKPGGHTSRDQTLLYVSLANKVQWANALIRKVLCKCSLDLEVTLQIH